MLLTLLWLVVGWLTSPTGVHAGAWADPSPAPAPSRAHHESSCHPPAPRRGDGPSRAGRHVGAGAGGRVQGEPPSTPTFRVLMHHPLAAQPSHHRRPQIMGALSGLKTKIVTATAQLDEIDMEHDASLKTKQALRLEQLDDTFKAIASGVDDLETIQRQVEGSVELAAPIKEQVMWNLRKMKLDVERLQGSALDQLQRQAIEKALELRFSVLLSPAFWQSAVDRSLLA